jgi:hypothetical protein
MERFFVSRQRAIALILAARQQLLAKADEWMPADAQPLYQDAAQLERLMLDVRAGRVDEFEMHRPTHVLVTISVD